MAQPQAGQQDLRFVWEHQHHLPGPQQAASWPVPDSSALPCSGNARCGRVSGMDIRGPILYLLSHDFVRFW